MDRQFRKGDIVYLPMPYMQVDVILDVWEDRERTYHRLNTGVYENLPFVSVDSPEFKEILELDLTLKREMIERDAERIKEMASKSEIPGVYIP